jgi:hypothetical protein
VKKEDIENLIGLYARETVVVPVTVELPYVARQTTLDYDNVTVVGNVN